MGLVKTGRRLAEDGSPYRAMRACCQCGSVASSNVANIQLRIGSGYWQLPLVVVAQIAHLWSICGRQVNWRGMARGESV